MASTFVKLQQPVPRRFDPPPPAWKGRLEQLDLRPRIAAGLQAECYLRHSASEARRPLGPEDPGPLPDYIVAYPKAARREPEAELTLLVWEERARLAAGAPLLSGAPRNRPSRVRGLSWRYEEIPEAVTIRLDGDLREKEEKPVPLRFTLGKRRRRSGRVRSLSKDLEALPEWRSAL